MASQLDLPRFKGKAGWEFTELPNTFSLDAFTPVVGGPFTSVSPAHVLEVPEGATELVQVDGAIGDGVAVEDGPVVLPLDVALERHPELVKPHLGTVVSETEDVFTSLNASSWKGGAFVWVPRGVKVEAPLLLTAVSALGLTALHRRVLVVLEEGAEAEVWDQLVSGGDDPTMVTWVIELVVGQNAKLRYVSAQDLNEKSFVFGTQQAVIDRDGKLDWVALGFGGGTGRIRMVTTLAGRGAEAKVTGAYAPHGRQHVDYDTYQEHAAPHCMSDLAFRGVLAGRSSSVWRGMIKVDPGAQETDGFQECRNLLLTKKAHADAIPGLEILANDVRCTHAAAIAQVDSDQIFYLRSRGLDEAMAKRLVVEGFLAALVERFEPGSPLREAAAAALDARLERVLG